MPPDRAGRDRRERRAAAPTTLPRSRSTIWPPWPRWARNAMANRKNHTSDPGMQPITGTILAACRAWRGDARRIRGIRRRRPSFRRKDSAMLRLLLCAAAAHTRYKGPQLSFACPDAQTEAARLHSRTVRPRVAALMED